ncbi:MAG: hypothetical protein WD342_12915 [Verrucomicrobiales bacterium]
MVGLIEEQHADRCRLFMQWKGMDWPVMVDSLNLLEVPAVPITLLIDTHGVIRGVRPEREEFEAFMDKEYPPPATALDSEASPPDLEALRQKAKDGSTEAIGEYAEALFLWGDASRMDEAVESFAKAVEVDPDNGWLHFRLGVAYRKRHDSDNRRKGDFARAVEHWYRALDTDPNQYIWRRRIQQYGPRLDKPYSFYDWVNEARRDIRERGEAPSPLTVEPGGAEFAHPTEALDARRGEGVEPDPEGRILRDEGPFAHLETTVVPSTKDDRPAARVHLSFRPNEAMKAHWNNEAEDMVVWIDPPKGWEVDSQSLSHPNSPEIVETRPRHLEFELEGPSSDVTEGSTLEGYALYYVCEDVDGLCLYRRQDFKIDLSEAFDSKP